MSQHLQCRCPNMPPLPWPIRPLRTFTGTYAGLRELINVQLAGQEAAATEFSPVVIVVNKKTLTTVSYRNPAKRIWTTEITGKLCFSGRDIRIELLKWVEQGSPTIAQQNAFNQWRAKSLAHEEQHARDIIAVTNLFTGQLVKGRGVSVQFKLNGSEAESITRAQADFDQEVKKKSLAWSKQMQDDAVAFHATPAGAPAQPLPDV